MIAMFMASTLYHAFPSGAVKRFFRVLDHQAIYLFIAGTYTPFCLLALPAKVGMPILAVEWLCALAGMVLYAINFPLLKKVELVVYIIMGWAIVAGVPFLRTSLPVQTLIFLLAGGLLYTMGVFWYVRKTRRGAHIVWHAFVLAGAVCHWWAVWFLGA
jgi:hemolysin III